MGDSASRIENASLPLWCPDIPDGGEWLLASPLDRSWPMLPLTFCGIGDFRGCELPGPLSGDMPSAGANPGGAPLGMVLWV